MGPESLAKQGPFNGLTDRLAIMLASAVTPAGTTLLGTKSDYDVFVTFSKKASCALGLAYVGKDHSTRLEGKAGGLFGES